MSLADFKEGLRTLKIAPENLRDYISKHGHLEKRLKDLKKEIDKKNGQMGGLIRGQQYLQNLVKSLREEIPNLFSLKTI